MRRATKARKNKNNRIILARYRAKILKAGWHSHVVWLPTKISEQLRARAIQIDVALKTVLQAAVEVGIRRLTTTEALQADRRWHEVVGFPVPKMVKLGLWRPKKIPGPYPGRFIFAGFEPVKKVG